MIPTLHTYQLADGVTAFSTTREGGVSEGNYGTFNINAYCGDAPEHIAQNRQLLCETLGIATHQLVMPHQVHGVEVRQIGAEFISLPENIRQMILEGVDAVITDQPNICIGVSTADCIPVLLYDPAHHAAAAIHAGWRGTLQRIVVKTIATMRMTFQTDPAQLHAVIAPGISLDSFEVGDEVYQQFEEAAFDMEAIAEQFPNPNRKEISDPPLKWHINLPQCNAIQLQETGIPQEHIIQTGICTFKEYERFFSARRLGINSGRIFTGILLKD